MQIRTFIFRLSYALFLSVSCSCSSLRFLGVQCCPFQGHFSIVFLIEFLLPSQFNTVQTWDRVWLKSMEFGLFTAMGSVSQYLNDCAIILSHRRWLQKLLMKRSAHTLLKLLACTPGCSWHNHFRLWYNLFVFEAVLGLVCHFLDYMSCVFCSPIFLHLTAVFWSKNAWLLIFEH